jgi:hypothetical protein
MTNPIVRDNLFGDLFDVRRESDKIFNRMLSTRGRNEVKQKSGISASLGAILSSLATMGCCLPRGFAAALGTAGASTLFATLRPWLLGISVVLLGVGFWQQRTAKQCAAKRSYLSVVLLWSALALVVGMILFPQEIAGFLADRFAWSAK